MKKILTAILCALFLALPLSACKTDEGGLNITSALVADPKMLPFEWSRKDSSRYGFSISSPDGQVQTAIFHGVLGNKHAQFKEGDKVVGSWYIITLNGDWRDAFELADKKIFAADNIREAFTCLQERQAAILSAIFLWHW